MLANNHEIDVQATVTAAMSKMSWRLVLDAYLAVASSYRSMRWSRLRVFISMHSLLKNGAIHLLARNHAIKKS